MPMAGRLSTPSMPPIVVGGWITTREMSSRRGVGGIQRGRVKEGQRGRQPLLQHIL